MSQSMTGPARLGGIAALLLLTPAATCSHLPVALPTLEGQETSQATAIDARGAVVGYSGEQAALWDRTGR